MEREIYKELLKNDGSGMHGYRFSMLGYADQDWMSNIPLIAVEPCLKARIAE